MKYNCKQFRKITVYISLKTNFVVANVLIVQFFILPAKIPSYTDEL